MKFPISGTAMALALAAAWLPACAAAQQTPQIGAVSAMPDELATFQAATSKLYAMKEKAFAQGDVDPIVNRFYAANAISVGPEGKPYEGRAAYAENYSKIVQTYNVKVEPIHAYVTGNAGWEWANFRVAPKDAASTEKPFSFVILFLWAKVNGEWVCAGDSYVVGEFKND
jgi:ketosteroid isomerase-like protein